MIPPKHSGEFVCQMEEVLAVYHQPHDERFDERFPVIRLDETNKQLVSETRPPLPMRPGDIERFDHEYRREGVAQIFLAFEPLANRRWSWVRQHKAAVDFADVVRDLLGQFPKAERVRLVVDNLNTHHGGSFYHLSTSASSRPWLGRWPSGSSSSTRPSTAVG